MIHAILKPFTVLWNDPTECETIQYNVNDSTKCELIKLNE